jgi:DNA-binding GntR family transcriptional regulator
MTHKTLRNFFMAAPMIYAATTRLAAEHATPARIARLKDCQRAFRQAIRTGDAAERALANERFHALIGEMADNEYLLPSLRRLLIDHTRISMTFYSPRKPELAHQRACAADQHDQFIALIEAGSADAAADLAVAHWELSRAWIESFVSPASVRVPLGRPPARAEPGGAS